MIGHEKICKRNSKILNKNLLKNFFYFNKQPKKINIQKRVTLFIMI
jgi:hypothetical protein